MDKYINYRLFYKIDSMFWKHFFFDAESDEKALNYAENWTKNNNVMTYGIEKITKEILL